METTVWLAIISALLGIISTLALLGYRDIARRIEKLERQDAKLFAAVTTLLMAKPTNTELLAAALHALLTNGKMAA